MPLRLAKFLSNFNYKGNGFFLQLDIIGDKFLKKNKAFIRKGFLIFDFGRYSKYWRIKNITYKEL